jgi:alanine-glyoxylate transaminase/serine-glyoxylate transaminase/serine-pyruvate transaminase
MNSMRLNSHPSGRHFLQIPGPTNVPDRILRAMDYPTIDHRGPEFNALAKKSCAVSGKFFRRNNRLSSIPHREPEPGKRPS